MWNLVGWNFLSSINLIIKKCNGDREILFNELQKIELYSKNGKQINEEKILKLINLIENHDISELINHYLIKNKKKVISILNENNFSNDECIIIARTFLNKAKRLNMSMEDIPSFERRRIAGKKKVNEFRDGFKILIFMVKNLFNF